MDACANDASGDAWEDVGVVTLAGEVSLALVYDRVEWRPRSEHAATVGVGVGSLCGTLGLHAELTVTDQYLN